MPQREAWRIVKQKRAVNAFTGEGSAIGGGRWNSRGMRVVYCSGSRSLAALEILVHLVPPVIFEFVAFKVTFNESLLEAISPDLLPLSWRAEPPATSTQFLGDDWLRRQDSAVLAVPSVIIPGELNYLLNPAHRDFKGISIGAPEPFSFDPRLLA